MFHSVVVGRQFPFEFHAADSHTNPFVQFLMKLDACGEVRGEVVRRPSDQQVQFHDDIRIHVVVPAGDVPNLCLEFLQ